MKSNDQIKALAELDGFTNIVKCYCGCGRWVNGNGTRPIPDYTDSYDAIILLIQKQDRNTRYKIREVAYSNCEETDCIFSSPAQLAEALLRATNRWIE